MLGKFGVDGFTVFIVLADSARSVRKVLWRKRRIECRTSLSLTVDGL